jgi:hypothetical protein
MACSPSRHFPDERWTAWTIADGGVPEKALAPAETLLSKGKIIKIIK